MSNNYDSANNSGDQSIRQYERTTDAISTNPNLISQQSTPEATVAKLNETHTVNQEQQMPPPARSEAVKMLQKIGGVGMMGAGAAGAVILSPVIIPLSLLGVGIGMVCGKILQTVIAKTRDNQEAHLSGEELHNHQELTSRMKNAAMRGAVLGGLTAGSFLTAGLIIGGVSLFMKGVDKQPVMDDRDEPLEFTRDDGKRFSTLETGAKFEKNMKTEEKNQEKEVKALEKGMRDIRVELNKNYKQLDTEKDSKTREKLNNRNEELMKAQRELGTQFLKLKNSAAEEVNPADERKKTVTNLESEIRNIGRQIEGNSLSIMSLRKQEDNEKTILSDKESAYRQGKNLTEKNKELNEKRMELQSQLDEINPPETKVRFAENLIQPHHVSKPQEKNVKLNPIAEEVESRYKNFSQIDLKQEVNELKYKYSDEQRNSYVDNTEKAKVRFLNSASQHLSMIKNMDGQIAALKSNAREYYKQNHYQYPDIEKYDKFGEKYYTLSDDKAIDAELDVIPEEEIQKNARDAIANLGEMKARSQKELDEVDLPGIKECDKEIDGYNARYDKGQAIIKALEAKIKRLEGREELKENPPVILNGPYRVPVEEVADEKAVVADEDNFYTESEEKAVETDERPVLQEEETSISNEKSGLYDDKNIDDFLNAFLKEPEVENKPVANESSVEAGEKQVSSGGQVVEESVGGLYSEDSGEIEAKATLAELEGKVNADSKREVAERGFKSELEDLHHFKAGFDQSSRTMFASESKIFRDSLQANKEVSEEFKKNLLWELDLNPAEYKLKGDLDKFKEQLTDSNIDINQFKLNRHQLEVKLERFLGIKDKVTESFQEYAKNELQQLKKTEFQVSEGGFKAQMKELKGQKKTLDADFYTSEKQNLRDIKKNEKTGA